MTKIKNISRLMSGYIKNYDNLDDIGIKIVENGFNLIDKNLKLNVEIYKYFKFTFNDIKSKKDNIEKGKIDKLIKDIEYSIKGTDLLILENNDMRKKYLK